MVKYLIISFFGCIVSFLVLSFFIDNQSDIEIRGISFTISSNASPKDYELYFSQSDVFEEILKTERVKSVNLESGYQKIVFHALKFDGINKFRLDPFFDDEFQKFSLIKMVLVSSDSLLFDVKLNKDIVEGLNQMELFAEDGQLVFKFKHPQDSIVDPYIVFSSIPKLLNQRSFDSSLFLKAYFLLCLFGALILLYRSKGKGIREVYFVTFLLVVSFFASKSIVPYFLVLFLATLLFRKEQSLNPKFILGSFQNYGIVLLYAIPIVFYLFFPLIFGVTKKNLDLNISFILIPIVFLLAQPSHIYLKEMMKAYVNGSLFSTTVYVSSILVYKIQYELTFFELYSLPPEIEKYFFGWIDSAFHPSFFFFVLSINLLFTIYLYGLFSVKSALSLVVFVFLLIFLSSRMAVIFMLLPLAYPIFQSLLQKFKLYILPLTIVSLVLLHFVLYTYVFEKFDYIRYALWKSGFYIFVDNFWFGIGDTFREVLPLYYYQLQIGNMPIFGHSHNQYLFYFNLGGFFLGVIFLCIHFKMLQISGKSGYTLFFMFMVLSSIFMTFDLLLNSLKGVVPFVLVLCILRGMSKFNNPNTNGLKKSKDSSNFNALDL